MPVPTVLFVTKAVSSSVATKPAGSGFAMKREKMDFPRTLSFTWSRASTTKSHLTLRVTSETWSSSALSVGIPMFLSWDLLK